MANNFLDDLGIDAATFEAAKDSTVTEAFEVLASGALPGTIESMVLYKNTFGGTNLKVDVKLDESERVLTYRADIGRTKKPTAEQVKNKQEGDINDGFVTRLKSIGLATNVDIATLKVGDATKVNSFGKECGGQFLLGCNGKPVIALVRHSVDTNKAEGEQYRDSNDIEGVTFKGSDDIDLFEAKIEKSANGTFGFKGYVKKAAANSSAPEASAEDKEKLAKMDF